MPRARSILVVVVAVALAVVWWVAHEDAPPTSGRPAAGARDPATSGADGADGARLVGQPPADRPQAGEAEDAAAPRIRGRLLAVQEDGSTAPAPDVEVVADFQAFEHRMGVGSYWIASRESAASAADGGFDLAVPQTGQYLSKTFLSVRPPSGWVAPARIQLGDQRVYVPLQIPGRIYHHSDWVSLPPPDGVAWPLDPSRRWAMPEIVLERAETVSGQVLDPWGQRVAGALVACLWSYGELGLERRLLCCEDGRFAFEVPASRPEVVLELVPRPRYEDYQSLAPPPEPRPHSGVPTPPPTEDAPKRPEPPRPRRLPWPGVPRVRVRPGTRGVVLQAHEEAPVSGRVRTETGRALGVGIFDVQPGPGTSWPLGFDRQGDRSCDVEREGDGSFTVHGLPAGRWILSFLEEVEDEATPHLGHVVVEAPCEGVSLVCRPAVRLRFSIEMRRVSTQWLQPATAPAPADWWSTAAVPALARVVEADDAERRGGRRGFHGRGWLEDAPGVLYAVDADGRCALLENVDPSAGVVDLPLRPGGTISGTVADVAALGFLERDVGTYTPSTWVEARRGHLVRRGRMEQDGAFVIDGLPEGAWEVRVCGEHVYPLNPRTRRAGVATGNTDVVLHAR